MSRYNLWSPLSVLISGLIMIAIILIAPDTRSGAAPQTQNNFDEMDTIEAILTEQAYPAGTNTTASPTRTTTATVTPTGTITSTTTINNGGTPTATRSVLETSHPTTAIPSHVASPQTNSRIPTPTPNDGLTCIPGVPILISGNGPARASFLLYFGIRIVSGGSVNPEGKFTTPLVVGLERPGRYTITVRVRGTGRILRRMTCIVPHVTPTPLPTPRSPSWR